MILTYIWCAMILLACITSLFCGSGAAVSAAALQGAQQAVTLSISIIGPLALWSGIHHVMLQTGITSCISGILHPLLVLLFPSCKNNPRLSHCLTGNICANLLGMGNAATPPGIEAATLLKSKKHPNCPTREMSRLLVLNTASIQLIPTTSAIFRQSAGSNAPFDFLPCVWFVSLLSVSAGIAACVLLERKIAYD